MRPMPNFAQSLKQEIARIARKQVRGETVASQRAVSAQRKQLAEMKRRMTAMEQELSALRKRLHSAGPRASEPPESL